MKEGSTGKTHRTGQTIIEMLVALTIIVIAITSISIVSFGNQAFYTDTEVNSKALQIAQSNLEETIALARNNFGGVAPSSSTVDIFTREIDVEEVSPTEKKITSTVTWDISPAKEEKVEIVQIITDPSIIINSGGDTGGTGIMGDWRNPRSLGSVDLGPGNSATGLDVINKIVYMSAEASADAKPDFFIINATDGQNPFIVSSLDLGKSLNKVDTANNYAYGASKSTLSQVKIIDVSNINTPLLATSFTLGGAINTGAISVFYLNSKIYIGTSSNAGPEFYIIDVSNPLSPSQLGSREIGGNVNAIYIRGDYAYLSTSINSAEVKILNISNPTNISEVGNYDIAGNYDALSNYLSGNNLFVGRDEGDDEFVIVNASNPSSIQYVSATDIDGDVNALIERDGLAFLGTDDSNREFQVWDVSNPSSPSLWSYFNFPQVISDLDFESNLVYAAVRSNDALRIITSSP